MSEAERIEEIRQATYNRMESTDGTTADLLVIMHQGIWEALAELASKLDQRPIDG